MKSNVKKWLIKEACRRWHQKSGCRIKDTWRDIKSWMLSMMWLNCPWKLKWRYALVRWKWQLGAQEKGLGFRSRCGGQENIQEDEGDGFGGPHLWDKGKKLRLELLPYMELFEKRMVAHLPSELEKNEKKLESDSLWYYIGSATDTLIGQSLNSSIFCIFYLDSSFWISLKLSWGWNKNSYFVKVKISNRRETSLKSELICTSSSFFLITRENFKSSCAVS